jgi:O-antigen/teichoic acid export membrane protein
MKMVVARPRLTAWQPMLRAVGTNTFASGMAASVALVCNVLISRQLGASARGEVAFVLQLAYLIAPFLLVAIDRQTLRADSKQESGRLTRHLVPITAVATLLSIAVFQDWRALAPVIALTTSWLSIRRSESLRDHSFARYVKAYLGYQVFIGVSVTVLFLSGNSDWHWWLLPYALPALIIFFAEVSRWNRASPRELFGHLNSTSLKLLPSTVATIVVMRADRLMMPALASVSQLGLYVAIATATEPIYWIAQALADHRVSRLPEGRSITRFFRSLATDAVGFTVVAAAAGVLISKVMIPLLGEEFASAGDLVLPLSIAGVILAVFRQLISWHLSGPSPEIVSVIEVTTAVFALPCYWFAILTGGALGAAWGSLAVYGFGAMLSLGLAILRKSQSR